MKKSLLSALCIGLCGFAAQADVTDVINLELIETAAEMEGITLSDRAEDGSTASTMILPVDGSLTDSGITYQLGFVQKDGENIHFLYNGYAAAMENPDGLYLKSVKVTYTSSNGVYSTKGYGRTTPVGFHGDDNNLPNVGWNSSAGSDWEGNTDLDYTVDYFINYADLYAEGKFQYVVVCPTESEAVESIALVWSETAPVATVKTPSLYLNTQVEGAYPAGTQVQVRCATEGVTFHYQVTNTATNTVTQSGEGTVVNYWDSFNFELEGQPGDALLIEAWCTKEGFETSEKATQEVTLTLPGLNMPNSNAQWGFNPAKGSRFTITNYNQDNEGQTIGDICYTINGGEVQKVAGRQAVIQLVGEIGDQFLCEVWVAAEGYAPSEKIEFDWTIVTNVLPAPDFSVESGEVRAGTVVQLKLADYQSSMVAAGFRYRINGGEWVVCEDKWNPSFKVVETCTVEAQTLAETEGQYDNYLDSEIVSAAYTLEVLGADAIPVAANAWGEEKFNSYTWGDVEINGVTFGFNGDIYKDYSTQELYFNMSNMYYCLTNKSAINEGIQSVKVDINGYAGVKLYFSDELMFDYPSVGVEGLPAETQDNVLTVEPSESGKWISLTGTANAGKRFVLMTNLGYGSNTEVTRLVVSTSDATGVRTVGEAAQLEGVYNLNGMKVSKENLTPGVYVVVKEGKASKVLVK